MNTAGKQTRSPRNAAKVAMARMQAQNSQQNNESIPLTNNNDETNTSKTASLQESKDRTIKQLKLDIQQLYLVHELDQRTITKLQEENEKLRKRVDSLTTKDDEARIQLLVADAIRRKLSHMKCLFEAFTKAQEHSMQPFKEFIEDVDKDIEKYMKVGAMGPPPKISEVVGRDKYDECSKFVPTLERICESPLVTPQKTPHSNLSEISSKISVNVIPLSSEFYDTEHVVNGNTSHQDDFQHNNTINLEGNGTFCIDSDQSFGKTPQTPESKENSANVTLKNDEFEEVPTLKTPENESVYCTPKVSVGSNAKQSTMQNEVSEESEIIEDSIIIETITENIVKSASSQKSEKTGIWRRSQTAMNSTINNEEENTSKDEFEFEDTLKSNQSVATTASTDNANNRPKRSATTKISSLKEPSLSKKMRRDPSVKGLTNGKKNSKKSVKKTKKE